MKLKPTAAPQRAIFADFKSPKVALKKGRKKSKGGGGVRVEGSIRKRKQRKQSLVSLPHQAPDQPILTIVAVLNDGMEQVCDRFFTAPQMFLHKCSPSPAITLTSPSLSVLTFGQNNVQEAQVP